MIIYLARHGQTTGDIENRYGGDYDDHLTELGRQQSMQLAESLVGSKIEQLYVSPRIRAQETGGIIADKLGLATVTLDNFRERNRYGVLTGLTKEEAAQKYPEQVRLVKDLHNTVEGAEPYEEFRTRIMTALDDLINIHAERVAIVTHGGPLSVIFRDILKLGEIEVGNCAYAVVEANNGEYKLLEKSGINISSR
jgi:uncharacterized phosphatase